MVRECGRREEEGVHIGLCFSTAFVCWLTGVEGRPAVFLLASLTATAGIAGQRVECRAVLVFHASVSCVICLWRRGEFVVSVCYSEVYCCPQFVVDACSF